MCNKCTKWKCVIKNSSSQVFCTNKNELASWNISFCHVKYKLLNLYNKMPLSSFTEDIKTRYLKRP